MKRFKSILVGVDLSCGDRLVGDDLVPPTREALERALWLAKINSSELTLLYSLDISEHTRHLIENTPDSEPTVLHQAQTVLAGLAEQAERQGVETKWNVVFGKSWIQVIQHVLHGGHDLVVVGTRHMGPVKSMLIGSTGMKLLRKCPCPVWVTQPDNDPENSAILVATDLTPVSDLAMELGLLMAQWGSAQLHVLHVIRPTDDNGLLPAGIAGKQGNEYLLGAKGHIGAQIDRFKLANKPQVHLVVGAPETAILDFIKQHQVRLVVMGTLARVGVRGLFTGNTAERLLPVIPCSVLAVKPEGFVSPISVT
jgi:universal stress protein E